MGNVTRSLLAALAAAAILPLGCEDSSSFRDNGSDADADADSDADADADSDSDTDGDTDTEYTGPVIPETCEQAAQATTTVGCEFYAVHLDTLVPWQPFAVAVSNPNLVNPAAVTVYQASAGGWTEVNGATVAPMDLYTFSLPEFLVDNSGLQPDRSYRIVSDYPIVAYQFNPVDGEASYLSDASMLIPVTSLSLTYDIVGWHQTANMGADEFMRAYFVAVAVEDGTVVTTTPAVAPLAGTGVPNSTAPFDSAMNDGDVLCVETANVGDGMTGSRVVANADHPIAVFSGQECAYIPDGVFACDHLEEQLPGLRFWGTEFVAARLPVRSISGTADNVYWQIYASADTTVTVAADPGVTDAPVGTFPMAAGQVIEFYAGGSTATPGDMFISSEEPIGVMQYMIGSENANCNSIGDPAMVYTSPTQQFLPRYVVLVPGTWINDALVITRHAGVGVLLDGVAIPDAEFTEVAGSGYEVARKAVADGIHTLVSADDTKGLGVVVVGWDTYDSYAYTGGMGMGALNPVIE